jgi:hypothetical protein
VGGERLKTIVEILGVILAAIGIVASAVFFLIEERGKTKQLDATLLSTTSLINPNTGSTRRSELRITYKGQEVSDVSTVDIRFLNSGAQFVKPEDIEDPLRIRPQNVQQLISAEVIDLKPQNLGVKAYVSANEVTLSKTLLTQISIFSVNYQFDKMQ